MKAHAKRRLSIPVLLAGVLLATPSYALSCAPFGVAQAFEQADASADRHVIAVGKLTFDERRLPKTDWDNQASTPALTKIPAKITGRSLGKNGFVERYDTALSLEVRCYGPWCAGAKSGATYMAFINIDTKPASVQVSPCGAGLISNPTEAHKREVQACLNDGKCQDLRLQRD